MENKYFKEISIFYIHVKTKKLSAIMGNEKSRYPFTVLKTSLSNSLKEFLFMLFHKMTYKHW